MTQHFFAHMPTRHGTMFKLDSPGGVVGGRCYIYQCGGRGGPESFELFIPCKVIGPDNLPIAPLVSSPLDIPLYAKNDASDVPCEVQLSERRLQDLDASVWRIANIVSTSEVGVRLSATSACTRWTPSQVMFETLPRGRFRCTHAHVVAAECSREYKKGKAKEKESDKPSGFMAVAAQMQAQSKAEAKAARARGAGAPIKKRRTHHGDKKKSKGAASGSESGAESGVSGKDGSGWGSASSSSAVLGGAASSGSSYGKGSGSGNDSSASGGSAGGGRRHHRVGGRPKGR